MFKLIATASIHRISPVIQVPNSNLSKRELILVETYTREGQEYYNFISIEFLGDRMPLLDNFVPGQRVSVEAMIRGRESRDGRFFNSISGLSISLYQAQQPMGGTRPAQAPAPGYQTPQYQQPGQTQGQQYMQPAAPQYPQQVPQQNQYPQTATAAQPPYGQSAPMPGVNDLPFPR